MTFFENELMKMFGKNTALSDIRCAGNALIGRLTPETIAKVSFTTSRKAEEYTSIKVSVINPRLGEVDAHTFNMSDCLGISRSNKVYIWNDNGDCWWCNFTPDKQKYAMMNREVEKYLEMFSEPVQGMNMSM